MPIRTQTPVFGANAGPSCPVADMIQRCFQSQIVQRRRPKLDSKSVERMPDLACRPKDAVQLIADSTADRKGVTQELEIENQGSQVLAHLVVKLRDPPAFVFLAR